MIAQTVLITGATDGIGLALAHHYAGRGARLLLLGRRPLAELTDPLFSEATFCAADLADPVAADTITKWLNERAVDALHVAYLNAGVGYVGPLHHHPLSEIARLVQVNFTAQTNLVHRLAPRLLATRGRLVLISSAAAPMPTPDYAVYTATKAALESFAANLRSELHAQGLPLHITVIRPGATRTGLHAKSGASPARMDWSRFTPADQVATAIIRHVEAGRTVASIGMAAQATGWVSHLAPGLLTPIVRARTALPRPMQPAARHPHIVITGAAAGIGRALVQVFAAMHGATAQFAVTAIDRNEAGLTTLAQELAAAPCDFAPVYTDLANLEQVADCVQTLAYRPPITVFIHNAGINAVGPFLSADLVEQARVTAVNLTAPLALTAGLLHHNRLAQGSTLVFISSLSHFVGYPGAAVYAATKDGLVSFARSLRAAFEPHICNVLTVFPGPTRTDHAARYSPDNRRAHRRMPPSDLAQRTWRAIVARRTVLVPGPINATAAVAARLAPGLMTALMRRALFQPLLTRRPLDSP